MYESYIIGGGRRALPPDDELHLDGFAQDEPLPFSVLVLDRDHVAAVLRPQRGLPRALADPDLGRDHPPAVRHVRRDRVDAPSPVRGDADEVVRRRAAPEPELAGEGKLDAAAGGGLPRLGARLLGIRGALAERA